MKAIIGTWEMALEGVSQGFEILQDGGSAADAAEHAVIQVENNPVYTSVGYGGLPALDGRVLLDAAWMDGQSLRFGAVMSVENVQNPVRAARLLCGRETNCLMTGHGAEQFAIDAGLPLRDMRTPQSMQQWREAIQARQDEDALFSYRGHDTVCVLALDDAGRMIAATSTSGLFLKEPGRVGDSPIIGSGFYCDARFGAAAATGLGEDIMRGCLSYEIVSLMRSGMQPAAACERALGDLVSRKRELGEEPGEMSVIALSPDGESGAATTLRVFPYAAGKGSAAVALKTCRGK